jgi:glycosyltransferase involved in cell wall biosynthesis
VDGISVVVTTWNLLPWHRRGIVRAREEVPREKGEIIVVDQASEDGTQFYLREALKAGLVDEVLLLDRLQSASVSRNRGVKIARCDRVLLLDGDIVMPRNWPRLAGEYLDKYPEHAAISIYPSLCTAEEGSHTDRLESLRQVRESVTSCTNLGLYRKAYLEAVPFPEFGAFGEAGWGFENTYQSQQGIEQGFKWAHCYDPAIAYLHPLNSSRELLRKILGEQEADERTRKRQQLFLEYANRR